MRIVVTGSIATDHLMTFGGRFADSLVVEQLDKISLSFLADSLKVHRGGVGANVAFGMAQLGLAPVLVGAVGADFTDYRAWLEGHGVDCASVLVCESEHTARFVCTTDQDMAQIATFYPGAMSRARDIDLASVAARIGHLDLVVVGPNDPEAMMRHSDECRSRGIPFLADPSQQLAFADGPFIRHLIEGAQYLFTNEYESELTEQKTGWSAQQILERVGTRVITRGKSGVRILRDGEPELNVEIADVVTAVDPTGVGDAFRAGFLAGLTWGLSPTRCAQLGSTLAAYVVATVGTQEYRFDRADFLARIDQAYGPDAAADIAPRLGAPAA